MNRSGQSYSCGSGGVAVVSLFWQSEKAEIHGPPRSRSTLLDPPLCPNGLQYSGFRVDGTGTRKFLLDGDPYKPPFGKNAIYSETTICVWSKNSA